MNFDEMSFRVRENRKQIVNPTAQNILLKYDIDNFLSYYRSVIVLIQNQVQSRFDTPMRIRLLEYYRKGYI